MAHQLQGIHCGERSRRSRISIDEPASDGVKSTSDDVARRRILADPARFAAAIALIASILGAVVGGAGTAVVTHHSQQAQFREERDRLVRERKLVVYQGFVTAANALIPVTNDLVDCIEKNKPANDKDSVAAVCAESSRAHVRGIAALYTASISVTSLGSAKARTAAAKVALAKGTGPLYEDYDSLKLGAAVLAFVDATHCETALIREDSC
jgi:hypothetical protein